MFACFFSGRHFRERSIAREVSKISEAIAVALITGGLSLLGVIVTTRSATRKQQENTRVAQAITDTKIEELTREVREHNNFARRVPVMEEQIKVINHRLADLEAGKE